jgi:predicted RNA-binding Zn ribbon-like protein
VETAAHVASLRFDGGHVGLDFVNTLGGLRDARPNPEDEHLREYQDLLAWCRRVDLLSESAAHRLAHRAARRGAEASVALRRALELRSTVDSVFRPLATGRVPPDSALRALGDAEREAIGRALLLPEASAFRWSWRDDASLDAPLWPLAHAAVELLTIGPLERLTVCDRCRWLFLDSSRNHSRRWCSMEGCGTDVKKRRYVERRRARRRSP